MLSSYPSPPERFQHRRTAQQLAQADPVDSVFGGTCHTRPLIQDFTERSNQLVQIKIANVEYISTPWRYHDGPSTRAECSSIIDHPPCSLMVFFTL